MEQKIRFKGLSLTPDELAQENGTMELCGNAELHDGALRPSVVKGTGLAHDLTVTKTISGTSVTKVCKLLYVHKTATYTHYIGECEAFSDESHSTLHWFDSDGSHGGSIGVDGMGNVEYAEVVQVESIGNTLVAMAKNGLHYILWKKAFDYDEQDVIEKYVYLGQKPPFVQLEFCAGKTAPLAYDRQGVTIVDSSIEKYYTTFRSVNVDISSGSYTNGIPDNLSDEDRHTITQAAWALINKAHNDITQEGHFYTNFVVRYCYRLYDGSMTMHSAPIFIPVAMPSSAIVGVENINQYNMYEEDMNFSTSADGTVIGQSHKMLLSYKPANAELMYRSKSGQANANRFSKLRNDWSDIVTSIDIFVSPQFLRISDSEPIKKAVVRNKCISAFVETDSTSTNYLQGCVDYFLNDVATPKWSLDIPEESEEKYYKKIRDNAVFYKVKSFQVDDTAAGASDFTGLDLKDVLPTLTSQEAMKDSYRAHHVIMPVEDSNGNVLSRLYVYNGRVNISAIKEQLFAGFGLSGLMPPCSITTSYSNTPLSKVINVKSIVFKLTTEDGDKFVKVESSNSSGTPITVFCLGFCLYFYPDSRAVMATVNYATGGSDYHCDIPLDPCLNLNGAMLRTPTDFWHNSFPGVGEALAESGPSVPDVEDTSIRANTIYTSAVNNPFYFPPESIYSVGTGTILGIAATTRAISQGQFGQYPLMAFATDGVWALDVSSKTGAFSSIHPISREVCVNPESICQLDQQVVFADSKGLAVLTEQNVTPISAALDGAYKDIASIAPGLAQYFIDTEGDTAAQKEHNAAIRSLMGFNTSPIEFLKDAKVFFDSANNRLLCYGTPEANATRQPIYVYSIGDGTWSTMVTNPILAAVNSYPYGYIQNTDGSVTCLDKPYPYADTNAVPTLIVTRALSFGDGVFSLANLAHSQVMDENTTLFVFGSNNLKRWHYVGRTNQRHVYYLPSRAYRYFRFALYNLMKPGEQYISTSFDVKLKFPKL